MHVLLRRLVILTAFLVVAFAGAADAQDQIAAKKPVFAGACKACPWGILASVTKEALKPAGYDAEICWVCWSSFGPREMADKTKPVMPPLDNVDPLYIESPPDKVPDISATSEVNLVAAWNGDGPFAPDKKKRQNYRVIAALQQPNYLITAANKKSGITKLSEIKDRKKATFMVIDPNEATKDILSHYGITEEGLKAKGGGFIPRSVSREMRAAADVFISNGLLVNTPEQRMWYEITQLSDLTYLEMDEELLTKLAKLPGYQRATMQLSTFRGVDKPIPTVMRSVHYIYVRDEAPDDFAYTVAKSLDEHQELFRMQAEPWYYDTRLVATTAGGIPMHPGAMKYYKERGYVK
jgi:TRAP-type uncharacterized transport system substrate-binding protein